LPLVVPAHAATLGVLEDAGLLIVFEAFLDRGYQPDGRLLPRGRPGAVLEDAGEIVERALSLAVDGVVRAIDGETLELRPDTLCLHGDGFRSARVARAVRDALERAGVQVRPAAGALP
jgi:5-oxoprolinase (ATP-hydrolysing) subunit A